MPLSFLSSRPARSTTSFVRSAPLPQLRMEKARLEKDLSISCQAYPEICWFSVAAMVKPDPRRLIGNRCLRIITIQVLCAPIEAIRAESVLGRMQATISVNILRSMEKGLRLPKDHPKRLAFSESAPCRLKSRQGARPDARLKTELLYRSLPSISNKLASPQLLCRTPMGHWDRGLSHCTVHPSLPGIASRRDSISTIKSAAPSL